MTKNSCWNIAYFLLFLLLFLQFPLRQSLPGNTDTLMAIALSNLSWERLNFLLQGLKGFTAMYPAVDVMAYGENCYGLAALFLVCRGLLQSDLWGYYLFLSVIFSLNAWAFRKLSLLFITDLRLSWLAGLAFTLTGFTFANIDDPNVVCLFLPVLALTALERGRRERKGRLVVVALALSGLQIWFGFYVFLFQLLALSLYLVFHGKELREFVPFKTQLTAATSLVAAAAPLVAVYLLNHRYADVYSPYDNPYSTRAGSLSWYHFTNVVPNNILYSNSTNERRYLDASAWYWLRKNACIGIVFPLLALVGLYVSARKTYFWLITALLFTALSFGTNLPGFNLLQELPLGSYFRVPSRFFLFALLPLSLYFAIGLEYLLKRTGWPLTAACLLLFFIENIPFPLPAYSYAGLLEPAPEYVEVFQEKTSRAYIVDLPTTYAGRLPDTPSVWSYSRDILYMNWQSKHRQVILGGVNSYIPRSRVATEEATKALPDRKALLQLKAFGATHLVFHKNLVLVPEENILEALKKTEELKLLRESDKLAIFAIQ